MARYTHSTRTADCPRCGAESDVWQTQWSFGGIINGPPDAWEPPDGGEDDWQACRSCKATGWTADEERQLIDTAGPWRDDDDDEYR
jgi:hypothetical protein